MNKRWMNSILKLSEEDCWSIWIDLSLKVHVLPELGSISDSLDVLLVNFNLVYLPWLQHLHILHHLVLPIVPGSLRGYDLWNQLKPLYDWHSWRRLIPQLYLIHRLFLTLLFVLLLLDLSFDYAVKGECLLGY